MTTQRFIALAVDACLGSFLLFLSALPGCSSGGACPAGTCGESAVDGAGSTLGLDGMTLGDLSGASDAGSADMSDRPGESCVSALPLPFVANRVVLNDTTLGRRDDTAARCGGTGGDTVYSLKVVAPYLSVEAVPVGAWSPHVYLKTYCENPAVVKDTCATSAFWDAAFPTGQYFLVVDSDGPGGDYKLTVEMRPTALGMGDSCSTPQLLTFTGDTSTVTTYLRGSSGGPKVRCASGPGEDIYTFLLGSPQKIEATVTASTPGFRPAVSLRGGGTACATGSDLECATAVGSTATIAPPTALDAGVYSLIVTSSGSTTGQYTLTVKVSP